MDTTNTHYAQFTTYLEEYITESKKRRIATILQERTRRVTIILENIYQSHNISAAVRSAECFGVQDVHIIENPAFKNYDAHNGITRGASEWITIYRHEAISDCIAFLKERDYIVVATTPHHELAGEKSFHQLNTLPIDSKIALLFGTEISGISDDAIKQADAFVSIPMYGFTESLNISVSVSICLYDISTRLHAQTENWQLSDSEQLELKYIWYKDIVKGSSELERRFLAAQ
jgi:tRNA (guanosine-2'-O-)-methyltransferase